MTRLIKKLAYNYENRSPEEIIETLEQMYRRQSATSKKTQPLMMWGRQGTGKSKLVVEFQKRLGDKYNKEVVLTDIRLVLYAPQDLTGLPMIVDPNDIKPSDNGTPQTSGDAEVSDEHLNESGITPEMWVAETPIREKFVKFVKPKILDLDPSDDVINIFFLDEINQAAGSVQALAFQLALDRKVGEHELPENTVVIAAGNPTKISGVSNTLPIPLRSRMRNVGVEVTLEAWKKWARDNNIHPVVVAYLNYRPEDFYPEVGDKHQKEEQANVVDPRKWEEMSDALHDDQIWDGMSPTRALQREVFDILGTGSRFETQRSVGDNFWAFLKTRMEMPPIEEVFAGTATEFKGSKKPDVVYAFLGAIHSHIDTQNPSDEQLTNAFSFMLSTISNDEWLRRFVVDVKNNATQEMRQRLASITAWGNLLEKTGQAGLETEASRLISRMKRFNR